MTASAPGTMRGVIGQVKESYFTAAALAGWVVTYDQAHRTWTLTATLTISDPYRLAQPGLVFVAPHKGGAWRWPLLSWSVSGADQFLAQLGPLEEPPHVDSCPTPRD